MNLKFWKKKAGIAEEAKLPGADTAPREPQDISISQQDTQQPEMTAANNIHLKGAPAPQLAARLKLWLAALKRHFQKPPEFRAGEDRTQAESDDSKGSSGAVPEAEPAIEASGTMPVRHGKRLIIAGAVSLLAVLLTGIVIANWPVSDSSQKFEAPVKQEAAGHAITPAAQPQPDQDGRKAEIETLRQENAELQAQIEALKMERSQPPLATPRQFPGKRPSSSIGGEVAVGNEDPKAVAMTLKEAIEAMNAASGDYNKKNQPNAGTR